MMVILCTLDLMSKEYGMRSLSFLVICFAFIACGDKKASFVATLSSETNRTRTIEIIKENLVKNKFEIISESVNPTIAKPNSALRPQTIISFENKAYAQMLLVCNPSMGLDIPFKIAVWDNYEGVTKVNYINPEYLSLTHNIKDKACIEIINRTKISIEKALDGVAK